MVANDRARARLATKTSKKADPFDPLMFSKRNDRWLTPLPLIEALGTFDLDPAGAPDHPTATTVWTPEEVGDGLSLPWAGRVWLNPPYGSEQKPWMEAFFTHGSGIALIPAATGTRLWQDLVFERAAGILFHRHRIAFLRRDGATDDEMVAPLASAFVAASPADVAALRASGIPGWTVEFVQPTAAPTVAPPTSVAKLRRMGAPTGADPAGR